MDSKNKTDIEKKHIPVLRDEVLSFFDPKTGEIYLDGTLGLGGHSNALLDKAEKNGQKIRLIGLDRDLDALGLATQRLEKYADAIETAHARFSEFENVLDDLGIDKIHGALIDIGVSSMQLDEGDRGFSFLKTGPLDMRMDQSYGEPASNFVNGASVDRIRELIQEYGEDPMAGRIARAIDDARSQKPIENTKELAEVIEAAYPAKWKAKSRTHPATRTFQALRMMVNNELEELELFLERMVPRLAPGGRIAVISFHSLEDRIVKNFFRDQAKGCTCPRQIPICICHKTPQVKVLTRRPLGPDEEEEKNNPRARSAKLRVAEKLCQAEEN